MGENYASVENVQARLSFTITANTYPNLTDLAQILDDADSMINKEAKVSINMTDTYGALRMIAVDLSLKMINNMLQFRYPELFPYVDIELTPEQKRDIHKAHHKFAGLSWELGG